MPFRLDHVPFYGNAGDLPDAFRDLGFQCSPHGFYTSPQHPDRVWETNCVFMERGWLDLLRVPRTRSVDRVVAGGCLFLADLEAAMSVLPDDAIAERHELERRWDGYDTVREQFELALLRESPCDLPAALIRHRWPCDDVDPAWTRHPNGAVGLKGVCCRADSAKPDSPAPALQNLLDVSQALDLPKDAFLARFRSDDARVALEVAVADLDRTARALRTSDIPHVIGDDAVLAYPYPIACVFRFTE